ncbi:MAG: hypothetical protein AMXMBFR53_42520 [Gemmatimonadota bacterium]
MTLERRVARLERRSRVLTVALLLVLGGAVAWRPQTQDVVRAHRVEVVDAQGRVRAVLDAREEGPSLRLMDASGVARASLADDAEGTALYLRDGEGTTRVGVAQFAHGGGGFALHGPEARGAAVLYLKGEGSLTFYGAEGGVAARFPPGG